MNRDTARLSAYYDEYVQMLADGYSDVRALEIMGEWLHPTKLAQLKKFISFMQAISVQQTPLRKV